MVVKRHGYLRDFFIDICQNMDLEFYIRKSYKNIKTLQNSRAVKNVVPFNVFFLQNSPNFFYLTLPKYFSVTSYKIQLHLS